MRMAKTEQGCDVHHSLLLNAEDIILPLEIEVRVPSQCHTRMSGLADVRGAEVQSDTTSVGG